MSRAAILLLAHRIPFPPDKGDKIRSFHWLDHLASRHDVYCGCFVDDRADWPHVPALRARCRDVAAIPLTRVTKWRRAARGLLTPPLTKGGQGGFDSPVAASITETIYRDRALRAAVAQWSAAINFDAVLAFSGAMAPYALAAQANRRVLDLCDCDSAKWRDYADRLAGRGLAARAASGLLRREAHRLAAVERAWLDRFDSVWLVHERERMLLDPAGRSARLHVIGNGVDRAAPTPTPTDPIVTFVGALDYPANVEGLAWFVREIWPAVRIAVPSAEFRMVGRAPCRSVRNLADSPGVKLIGPVPDVTPHLRAARVCVAPLRIARGVQNKVLEAMAHGRAVVATSAVAAGVDALDGEHLLVRDAPAEFAASVARLLSDREMCERIGTAGRRRMEDRYDWSHRTAEAEADLLGCRNPALTCPATLETR